MVFIIFFVSEIEFNLMKVVSVVLVLGRITKVHQIKPEVTIHLIIFPNFIICLKLVT